MRRTAKSTSARIMSSSATPARELKKISLDEFYKNFTGVLLLMNPTSEFKGGKIEKGGMFKRYVDLLLPQKKLFCLCDPEFSDRYDPGHCLLHVQQDPDGRGACPTA